MSTLLPHTRFLLLVAALAGTAALSACDGLAESPDVADVDAIRPRPDLLVGTGNLWPSDVAVIEERLDEIETLGLNGIRFSITAGNGLLGGGTESAATVVEACRRRGFRILFGIADKVDELESLDLDDIRDGGAAWGRFARNHEDVIVGFSILNEFDNQALSHEMDLGEGTPAGIAARQAIIDRAADIIHAFAEGIRSEWDGGAVVSGGMAFPTWAVAEDALRALAPDIRSGLLDGVGMHWYFDKPDFQFTGNKASLKGDPIRVRADGLLSAAGLPLTTPIYVQETNVKRSTFGSPEEASQALKAVLNGLLLDTRVKLVFPFSPWPDPEKADDYMLQAGTPAGTVVATFARGVRGLS